MVKRCHHQRRLGMDSNSESTNGKKLKITARLVSAEKVSSAHLIFAGHQLAVDYLVEILVMMHEHVQKLGGKDRDKDVGTNG